MCVGTDLMSFMSC